MLTVSDFQILIKSCSIKSRNDQSPKSEVVHETKLILKISYLTHVCLALVRQLYFLNKFSSNTQSWQCWHFVQLLMEINCEWLQAEYILMHICICHGALK